MKILKMILLILSIIVLAVVCYFFVGFPKAKKDIVWGVNFSQKHVEAMGLDWKKVYFSILDDLGVKEIKLATHWDFIEREEGKYYFDDLDWQISEAEKRGAKLILVIGMKTPRWPECHEPPWVQNQKSKIKNQKLLEYIAKIVNRYKDSEAIWAWQVENEPFFSFGECLDYDNKILKDEIELVKKLDFQKRPIIISESGEFSFWTKAARYGDLVGVTLYRRVWSKEFNIYFSHIFPPTFYKRRALLINKIFGKEVICIELQAEPWGPKLLYDLPLEEQEKSMDLQRFQKNIEFAQKTGFKKFYLWGAEWWYWLKEKQNKPEIWEEAKKLF